MSMTGVLVNTLTVIIGSTIGLVFKKGIPQRVSDAVMTGLGLCTIYIGIDGALAGQNVLITIASMVEKESAFSGESMDISSVIYNRLSHPNYPFLNIDATLVYALDGKTELTEEDKNVDSPYNTYKYEGLPPGPIANPGLLSLKAALNPSDSKYYFYALDPTAESREHRFFETYQQHLDFINKHR